MQKLVKLKRKLLIIIMINILLLQSSIINYEYNNEKNTKNNHENNTQNRDILTLDSKHQSKSKT